MVRIAEGYRDPVGIRRLVTFMERGPLYDKYRNDNGRNFF